MNTDPIFRKESGLKELGAAASELQEKIGEMYVNPQYSPAKKLEAIMSNCHAAFRIVLLRLGQIVSGKPNLAGPFDDVVAYSQIASRDADRWVPNTRALARRIALKQPDLKESVIQGLQQDILLSQSWLKDVIAEIEATFLQHAHETPEDEEEPNAWLAAVAAMQFPPPGPQPIPVHQPVMPHRGAGSTKAKP